MHKIQDGRQKWREKDFWEKSPVHSTDTLWVENLVEIALTRTVMEINACLPFMQKLKMSAKNGGKMIIINEFHYFLVNLPAMIRFTLFQHI